MFVNSMQLELIFLCNLATFVFELESLVHLLLLGLNIYVDLFQLSYCAVVFYLPTRFPWYSFPFFSSYLLNSLNILYFPPLFGNHSISREVIPQFVYQQKSKEYHYLYPFLE